MIYGSNQIEDNELKSLKNICTFCQTPIKNEPETFLCPSCNSPYHKDCWIENKGCAVYGCVEKIKEDDEITLREAIINIEYLINRNQYSEAIYEAKQFLKIDRRNSELKNLYNKAVAIINNKINLMSSGDEAFEKKDYKAAEIYYKNVLKYADEIEANFVDTRLEIIKEKIPEQRRRRVYQNIIIILIILAILSAIGYLGYYTFVLKEDRDFAELVKSDNAKDLRSMEQMINKYENFIKNYGDGKNKIKAIKRINNYSYSIASNYYKDDWRLALKYYYQITNTIDSNVSKNLYNNIYSIANNEYKEKILNAKKLNSISKYSEALNELNNAMSIVESFPVSEMVKEKNIVQANITLLNKKISLIAKYNDLEREIREQDRQLSILKPTESNKNPVFIVAKLNKIIDPSIYVGKEVGTGNTVAIKSGNVNYKIGQLVNLQCITNGELYLEDENNRNVTIPLYIPYFGAEELSGGGLSSDEKEAIAERLKNLKTQKSKLDSLLRLNLL